MRVVFRLGYLRAICKSFRTTPCLYKRAGPERDVFDCDVNERPRNRALQHCFQVIPQPVIHCILGNAETPALAIRRTTPPRTTDSCNQRDRETTTLFFTSVSVLR